MFEASLRLKSYKTLFQMHSCYFWVSELKAKDFFIPSYTQIDDPGSIWVKFSSDCIFKLPNLQFWFERGKIWNHWQIRFAKGTALKLKVGLWENW